MANIWRRLMAGTTAFKEAYLHPDGKDESISEWGEWEARQLRYDIYRGFANNSVYSDAIHRWSKKMKADYGLYTYTRDIYNPTHRLTSFYETYIWGGMLDPEAGNSGALPIVTDNDNLRPAIAQIWEWSNWRTKRNIVPRQGSLLGDVILRIVDNDMKEKVYLQTVNPAWVKELVKDDFGNVKAYIIEYERQDDVGSNTVTFTETGERDGDDFVTRIYKNNAPYAWDNYETFEWVLGYGFVPMVHIQHQDNDDDWGMSELAPRLSTFMELDDQASKLNDQIRKAVDPFWLFSGVDNPATAPAVSHTAATSASPQKGREESNALYGPSDAKAQALVTPLDIAAVSDNIQKIIQGLESDYPELALHQIRAGGAELSGRAVRLLRGEAETKAGQKRDIYDAGLIKAQQMAVAIAGWRDYKGFEGFGLDSYDNGDLDHHIGQRAVFAQDPLDVEEIEAARLANLQAATVAGYPLAVYMQSRDYSEDDIAAVVESPEYQARQAMMRMGLEASGELEDG